MDNKLQRLIKPTYNQAYDSNVITVKRMGNIDKVCYSAACRQAGVSLSAAKKGSVFAGKLDNNISRTRSTILEYALCNDWDYFATLTIDSKKFNRYDLKTYQKALSQWLHNYNRNGVKVSYLLIPEFHKDGAIHMHGLLSGVPENDLFTNANGYLDWLPYRNRFGYISLGKIKDHYKTALYITKYVTKELALTVQECNSHLYFSSKGLSKATRVYKAVNSSLLATPTFETEHFACVSLDNTVFDFHDYIVEGDCIYDLNACY